MTDILDCVIGRVTTFSRCAGQPRVRPDLSDPGPLCDVHYKEVLTSYKVASAPVPAPAPHVYPSGAQRSAKAPHYHSIRPEFLRRIAIRHTGQPFYDGGDSKYGEYNWMKGLPWQDTFNHLIDHLFQWKAAIEQGRLPDEDDLAAAALNIEFLMYGERAAAHEMAQRQPPVPAHHPGDPVAPAPAPTPTNAPTTAPPTRCESTYMGHRCKFDEGHSGVHKSGGDVLASYRWPNPQRPSPLPR